MNLNGLHHATAALIRGIFRDESTSWPGDINLSVDTFMGDVNGQGMAPVLWHRIAGSSRCDDWPEAVVLGLRNIALQEAATELVLETEITSVLNEFAGINVTPVLLKGTPLSYTLYPAPGMRPRCDTDLLIPESAREQTIAMMKELGYEGLYESAVEYISSQMSYSRQGELDVWHSYDIHWRVSNNNRGFSRRFNYDRLFRESIGVPALGDNARALSDVDALLLACFHRAGHFSHSGDRLIWLYDIHLLSGKLSNNEAAAFCQRARELEIAPLCADGVATACSWFDTSLPPALELLLQEQPADELSNACLRAGRTHGIRSKAMREIRSLPSWRERLRFILQNAFPPVDYMLWRYDEQRKWLLPWLYLRRFAEAIGIVLRR